MRHGNKREWCQVYGMMVRSDTQKPIINLYMLPNATTKLNSKPPVESRERVEAVCDLSVLKRKAPDGTCTRVLTDGAQLYPKLCRDLSLKHHACNHSKGVFCVRQTVRERGTTRRLMIHTGSLDGFWKHLKAYIPESISSKRRKLLEDYMRSFQWRWENEQARANLMRITGHALRF